jgi:hypothetical protein
MAVIRSHVAFEGNSVAGSLTRARKIVNYEGRYEGHEVTRRKQYRIQCFVIRGVLRGRFFSQHRGSRAFAYNEIPSFGV